MIALSLALADVKSWSLDSNLSGLHPVAKNKGKQTPAATTTNRLAPAPYDDRIAMSEPGDPIAAGLTRLAQLPATLQSMQATDAMILIERTIEEFLDIPATANMVRSNSMEHCRDAVLSLLGWGAEVFGDGAAGAVLWECLVRLDRYLGTECIVMNTSQEENCRVHIDVATRKCALAPKIRELPRLLPLLESASDEEQAAFSYIDKLIRSALWNAEGQTAIAGLARFGWSADISVVVAFIGGVKRRELPTTNLAFGIPIIEINGGQMLASDGDNGREYAGRLLSPSAHEEEELLIMSRNLAYSGKKGYLRKERIQKLEEVVTHRGMIRLPPLVPGQSVSGRIMESKGTFTIFVKAIVDSNKITPPPSDSLLYTTGSSSRYGITAFHVTNPTPIDISRPKLASGSAVIAPGRLDILSKIHQELLLHKAVTGIRKEACLESLKELINRIQNDEAVAENITGSLGSDGRGWREDWSLLRVNEKWACRNDSWWDFEEIEAVAAEFYNVTNLDTGIRGQRPPVAGDIVFKDGATTKVTVGIVGAEKVLAYYKGSIDPADSKEKEWLINVAFHMAMWPLDGQRAADSGDSGSPCITVDMEGAEGKMMFVGMLVSAFDARGLVPKKVALLVPQQELFRQMHERTGVEWEVDVGTSTATID